MYHISLYTRYSIGYSRCSVYIYISYRGYIRGTLYSARSSIEVFFNGYSIRYSISYSTGYMYGVFQKVSYKVFCRLQGIQ